MKHIGLERVSLIHGKRPVLFVCPHGADDNYTQVVTEESAETIDGYAVINRGFQRADQVDVLKDKADCNRINHLYEPIVCDEFLIPMLRFKEDICQKFDYALIIYIHGFGTQVEREVKESVDLILGCGYGTKQDSLTCPLWRLQLFVHTYQKETGQTVYIGGNSKYAGRRANNLNQYFRKHDPDLKVESLQVEISPRLRNSVYNAQVTGVTLATVIDTVLDSDGFDEPITLKVFSQL